MFLVSGLVDKPFNGNTDAAVQFRIVESLEVDFVGRDVLVAELEEVGDLKLQGSSVSMQVIIDLPRISLPYKKSKNIKGMR